ncbi:MAG: hypothetical protein U5Q16_16040, partial [Gammaproteobacteria bacterium]|nr:hypothetical protein [Gammaproteobacteria bacterium]
MAPCRGQHSWGNDVEPSVAGARRYEALGQRDDASIAALAETVAWRGAPDPGVRCAAGRRRWPTGCAPPLRDLDVPVGIPGPLRISAAMSSFWPPAANDRGALAAGARGN